MNQAVTIDPLYMPSRFGVLIGVVDPADPSLPVEHFDAVRHSIMMMLPMLLARLQLQACVPQLSVRRDDHHHFLDVLLVDPEPSSQPLLFEEFEPRRQVPADVAASLAAEVRSLLYTLMTKEAVSIGVLRRSIDMASSELSASIRLARDIRRAPGSQVALAGHGITHVLDLGLLDGIESLNDEVKVSARVRATGPDHAYLVRMELLSDLREVKMPSTGWLTLPTDTPVELRRQLEEACQTKERVTLALQLWIHRVYRTVREIQPACKAPQWSPQKAAG